ncbi:RdRP-domain-containing protein [Rhizophagus irregularis]|uniref:RNA-dependent RNA polymerase n=1 Tax=Rhizophagus irregularis TaxID=588596 RepID=A0A2I1G1T1_9GLOM|nr:RdRP-domain-containing protein [Rhizophagus irregularis]
MNNSPSEFDYHKAILSSIRRLNNATKNFPGRINPDDVFVTNDQRYYMYEIVKTDPESLNNTIRQFIHFINDIKLTGEINISQLHEMFTENLIRAYSNLPGGSDDDDEWLSQNSGTFLPSPPIFSSQKSLTSPKSKNLLTSRPKIEPKIENPWVTQYYTSTELPKEYKNYIGGITFLGTYEITRILKPFGPIEPSGNFWNQIIIGSAIHEVLYEECKLYFEKDPNFYAEMTQIINRNLSRVWTLSSKEFSSVGPRSHILFSGEVDLKDRRLVLTLLPPKIGISKRYYRMFSSERFLHLKIITDINSLDNKQKSNLKKLLLQPLSLAGRTYEFLYAKSDTLYYFATRGFDISKNISIKEVIDYNLPIDINKSDTTAKFYSRISLGFSNSTSTVIFEPNEILYDEEDIKNDQHCFTDGCSAISLAAMREAAKILGFEETPSVLQGRIGGAKGVWYIEPKRDISGKKWIKLRKSQTKYNLRNIRDEVHLRTLEVLHVALPPKNPASLNSQFIRVLIEGGVHVEVFLDIVRNHIKNIKSQVVDCDDPHSLITWVMSVSNIMTKRMEMYNNDSDDIFGSGDAISGFPNSPSEQCIQLLQAGFTPSTCPFLAKKLKCVLSYVLKSHFSKLRIDVPLSRTLICIADPTGTLKPGEIFIQLDKEAGRDERTGLPFGIIEDEVIIARNPSNLPSDIVRVKAVKNVYLSMYYNVVVFPIKGNIPLASYLSGGDYDGDKIFCCWEPQIVQNFKNSPVLPIDPSVENAFTVDKKTVDELLSSTTPDKIEIKLQEVILDTYFKDLEPTLGLYDRWHRLQSSKYGLSNKSSIYLAQMCAKLVDATKQGLNIKPNVLQYDSEFGNLPVPYWMDKNKDSKSRNRESHLGVMDLLCKSIENEMKEINSKDFLIAKMTKDPDPHIKEFWFNELTRAEQMNREEGLAYKEDLDLIYKKSFEMISLYNSNYYEIFNDDLERKDFPFGQATQTTKSTSSSSKSKMNDKFKGVDYEFILKFLNTPSVDKYKSNIFKYLKDRGSLTPDNLDPLSMFELQLKAAALHLASIGKKPTGQGCWVIAFRILCNIKSQMIDRFVVGGPRTIIEEVWQSMKVDKKWVNH